MNSEKIRFRASSMHYLMTEPKTKAAKDAGELSQTAKTHCVDVFVSWKYGRKNENANKYTTKGNAREQDSITLFSLVTKKMWRKNTERKQDNHFTGEWDLEGDDMTVDIKTSWDMFTYQRAKNSDLDDAYFYQGQVYMALTGAKQHTVAFCLVNGTPEQITDEKYRLARQLGLIDIYNASDSVLEKFMQIERNHIFDLQMFLQENPRFEFVSDLNKWTFDVPMNERVSQFTFDRDDAVIDAMRAKCERAERYILNHLNR